MKAAFKKDLSHSYMILTDLGDAPDDYSIRILLTNRIRGILPLTIEHLNNEIGCRYDITGLQPFTLYCERIRHTPETLKTLYLSIMDSLNEAEDYLLDPDHLLLDPEYLFVHWEKGELHIPYLPEAGKEIEKALTELTEYLLTKVGHSNHECVVLLCNLLHELERPNARLENLRALFLGTDSGADPDLEPEMEEIEDTRYESPFRGHTCESESKNSAFSDRRSISSSYLNGTLSPEENRFDSFAPSAIPGEQAPKQGNRFLPDRDTILCAVGMTAFVAAIWILSNLQTYFPFDPVSRAGLCLLAAALFLLLARAIIRYRDSRDLPASDLAFEIPLYRPNPADSSGSTGDLPRSFTFSDKDNIRASSRSDSFSRSGSFDGAASSLFRDPWEDRQESDRHRQEHALFRDPWEDSPETGRSDETVLLEPLTGRHTPAVLTPVSSKKGLEPIHLRKDDLILGHKESYVDQYIPDPSVSRIHARLIRRDGKWYVSDLGSTNGTSVDGSPVAGKEERILTEGVHVTFAGCEYLFHEENAV